MSSQTIPITFIGAHSPRKDLLGIISCPDAAGSSPYCRFFTWSQGQWGRGRDDWGLDCVSITYLIDTSHNDKAWWLLGKNGEAIEIKAGVPRVEQIEGAGLKVEKPYGYLSEIRNIHGRLYACGDGRQVYQRDGSWMSISDCILTHEPATGFFDIDGNSRTDIYAVGWKGEIWHYDSKTWRKDGSPTGAHLAAVRCLDATNVWIAGNKGIVLHGSFNRWSVIQDPGFSGNWYSLEEFDGRIYLAGNGVLGMVEGNRIKMIDVGLDHEITTHHLHAKEGRLWSIGEKDILVFDGDSWKEIIHPDNA